MTDLMTIRGFVATSPTLNRLPSGQPVTNFRLASTPRWYDSQAQAWKEGATNWYTVNAFKTLAQHVNQSIFVGQPIIITGRLTIKQWSKEDGRTGTSVEIDATAIGHDLNLGTSSFSRAIHPENSEHEPKNLQTHPNSANQSEETHSLDPHKADFPLANSGLVEGDITTNADIAAMV